MTNRQSAAQKLAANIRQESYGLLFVAALKEKSFSETHSGKLIKTKDNIAYVKTISYTSDAENYATLRKL